MYKIILFAILIVAVLSTFAFCQEEEIENILEGQEEYSDVSNLLDILNELENHPLDVNKASAQELAILPWISDVLAHEIVSYRNKNGKFRSLDELTKVKDFNPSLLPLIKKYLTVSSRSFRKDFSLNLKTRTSRKLEEAEGFKTGYYYPSPEKIYNRAICNYGEALRFGALMEKDSGEKKYNDLTVYFLKYSHPHNGNTLIIGNYILEFGQGLVFWNPYGQRKGSNPIYAAKKRPRDLREYTLVDENSSLFGISSKICVKFYQILLFYSSNKLDASVDPDDNTVTNFYTSGYHRNEREIAKKDQLTEQLGGMRLAVNPFPNLSLGLTGYISRFSRNFVKNDPLRYRYSFRGSENNVIGFDYDLTLRHFNLFGEIARSGNSGFGILSGIIMDARPVRLTVLFRNYSKDFHSLHGNGFGERTGIPQNEIGFYFGMQFNPYRTLKFSLYFDQYKFPWRTYLIPMPSQGKEIFAGIKYKPVKKLWLYFQIRSSRKEKLISSATNAARLIVPKNQINARIQLDYNPTKNIKLRQRLEKKWGSYTEYPELANTPVSPFSGILLYQDVSIRIKKKFVIATRLTFFDTDSYDSRLYQFERDVPGVLTNQMLYGKGTRWYIFAQWKIGPLFKISLKFGSTHYYYQQFIGSQADRIAGDRVNAINFQLETYL